MMVTCKDHACVVSGMLMSYNARGRVREEVRQLVKVMISDLRMPANAVRNASEIAEMFYMSGMRRGTKTGFLMFVKMIIIYSCLRSAEAKRGLKKTIADFLSMYHIPVEKMREAFDVAEKHLIEIL